ncbi:glycoside hydrolase family 105 protein [Paenibacillus allorhizosphaerae]|uniref:Unsaturated rhamnogalacturonyl hydrolase YteR n=1 Tax=Paenibacillus allorhizosphaerae TaxID=2849866 RepID=A0ABN7TBJ5_9BACL|nr:glycoside hydrolase family 88 protein [Paenibacillus allorhizosphaerae]CAG7619109.1 Unsaturated rhamnogalacturonyl hydrolase YteR [Paenibacillus allorhizosphaerae]
MEQQTSWAVQTAESIMSASDPQGYHPELAKRWAYVPGMTLLAFARLWRQTGERKYYDYVKKHMDLFLQPDGSIRGYTIEEYNLDQVNQGKVLFPLLHATGEPRFEKAAHLLAAQLKGQPRTSEGGFWHKKVYPFQMWLDGLYMSSPFLAEYAKTFGRPELFDEVATQILLVERNTRDPKTGLLYHGWDESGEQRWCDPQTGRSPHFWSRAMGWYTMAVVDALEHFPVDHPKRGTICGIFERMAGALEEVQDPETGLWHQVLDCGGREGNYLEASGSSMFVYAIAKGVRLGYLSRKFKSVAGKGFRGLLERLVETNDSGLHLHRICNGAGLGGKPYRDGSYTYYVNEAIVSDVFMGLAPFMLASMEMETQQ